MKTQSLFLEYGTEAVGIFRVSRMNGLIFENQFHFRRIFGKHCHCIPVLIVRGNQSHWVITLWSSFLIKANDNFLCLQVDKVYNIYAKSNDE